MAILDRELALVFADAAPASDFGVIGSFAAGAGSNPLSAPPTTSDVAGNPAFGKGLDAIVERGNLLPALEEFNSLFYAITKWTKYLYQEGIAEWMDGETYRVGSIVKKNGVLYRSISDYNAVAPPGAGWTGITNASLSAATNTDTNTSTPAVADNSLNSILQTIWNKMRSLANFANELQQGINGINLGTFNFSMIFTANGTFYPIPGVSYFIIAVGGGGSGGEGESNSVTASGGGGGGAGEMNSRYWTATSTSEITVTVGNGGLTVNSTYSDGISGNKGGISRFGTAAQGILEAAGGMGGGGGGSSGGGAGGTSNNKIGTYGSAGNSASDSYKAGASGGIGGGGGGGARGHYAQGGKGGSGGFISRQNNGIGGAGGSNTTSASGGGGGGAGGIVGSWMMYNGTSFNSNISAVNGGDGAYPSSTSNGYGGSGGSGYGAGGGGGGGSGRYLFGGGDTTRGGYGGEGAKGCVIILW